ncbi:MAG: outer membrane beta-barrel protein [Paracoccaceae bacterium]|nr:outer membrane beta-barrel protein [Paracoccaceae bacterium]
MKSSALVPVALALAVAAGSPCVARAQGSDGLLGLGRASVTYGPYVRGELGGAFFSPSDAYWLPPGYPSDPRIDFNLSGKTAGFGSLNVGYDWMNGFRADVGLLATGSSSVTGPHTTAGLHADITSASVSTTAVMASVFYSPLEQQGINARLQPFLVAGVGLANNSVSDWTRTNTAVTPVNRTFSGATHTYLALSVGVGVSYQLTAPGVRPMMLELAYRYYSFGSAEGGFTPQQGASLPKQPLTFRNNMGVVSLSLRIPLNRL